jgi:hypothetical protein
VRKMIDEAKAAKESASADGPPTEAQETAHAARSRAVRT